MAQLSDDSELRCSVFTPLTKLSRGPRLYNVANFLSNCCAESCEGGVVTINTPQQPLLKTGANTHSIMVNHHQRSMSVHLCTIVTIDRLHAEKQLWRAEPVYFEQSKEV